MVDFSIAEIMERVNKTAIEHGWWDHDTEKRPIRKFDCPECDGTGVVYERTLSMNYTEIVYTVQCKVCHGIGFIIENNRNFGEICQLISGEINEAHEEFRDGHHFSEIYYSPEGKPEGITVELVDAFIRIADFIQMNGLQQIFMRALEEKAAYNETRPYRHGGKLS